MNFVSKFTKPPTSFSKKKVFRAPNFATHSKITHLHTPEHSYPSELDPCSYSPNVQKNCGVFFSDQICGAYPFVQMECPRGTFAVWADFLALRSQGTRGTRLWMTQKKVQRPSHFEFSKIEIVFGSSLSTCSCCLYRCRVRGHHSMCIEDWDILRNHYLSHACMHLFKFVEKLQTTLRGGGWTTDLNTLLTLLIKKNSSSQNFQVKKQHDIWNQHITSSHGSLLRIEEPTVGLGS